MGNFNGGGGFRGGNKRGFGGGRDSGRQGGGFQKREWSGEKREVVMHSATCGDCGANCEVPFRPTEGKPVYCKDCFAKRGGRDARNDGDKFPRKDFGNRDGGRPSFGGDKNFGGNKSGGDDTKKAIDNLTIKIDRLIQSVENLAHMKFAPEVKKAEVVAPAKVVVVAPKAPATVVKAPAKKAVKKAVAKKGKK